MRDWRWTDRYLVSFFALMTIYSIALLILSLREDIAGWFNWVYAVAMLLCLIYQFRLARSNARYNREEREFQEMWDWWEDHG